MESFVGPLRKEAYVYFELETTNPTQDLKLNTEDVRGEPAVGPSKDNKPDVVHIGAVGADNEEFSVYIKPTKPILPATSALTGITFEDGVMCRHGESVPVVSRKEAVQQFMAFLGNYKGCVLMGYNVHEFHGYLLRHMARCEGTEGFERTVTGGLLDLMEVFNETFEKNSKLEKLFKRHLGVELVHHALKDAVTLKALVEQVEPTQFLMEVHTVPIWDRVVHSRCYYTLERL